MFLSHQIKNAFYRARIAGAKFFVIGRTVLGRPILACHVGSYSGPQLLVHGAIHAREHITTLLVCRQIEFCLRHHKGIGGIYFVPLVNVDGVDIALNGTNNMAENCLQARLKEALRGQDHRLFKANANLVDLNVNFDANWGKGKSNTKTPGTQNYVGTHPHSERETRALVAFARRVRACFTISYHCKGEEIYYRFGERGLTNKLHYAIAKNVAALCGYEIKTPRGSCGGFKDYVVARLGTPSVTIEVGSDDLSHPLGSGTLPKILKQQLKVPLVMLEHFVLCDIINPWSSQKSRKKTLCDLRYFAQSARKKKKKFQSVL